MIEAVIAESLKGNYRDKLDFPDGIGIYYQQKPVSAQSMTLTQKKKKLAISYNFWGRATCNSATVYEGKRFFFSTNIQFIIC